ncbi:MAG: hypothetical protein EOM25_12640 [Deltaproteobacteria bacterium]|nr:hypothetical protein [Deltaproteobacteria bacterium]
MFKGRRVLVLFFALFMVLADVAGLWASVGGCQCLECRVCESARDEAKSAAGHAVQPTMSCCAGAMPATARCDDDCRCALEQAGQRDVQEALPARSLEAGGPVPPALLSGHVPTPTFIGASLPSRFGPAGFLPRESSPPIHLLTCIFRI